MNGQQKAEAYQRFHPLLAPNIVADAINHSGEIISRFVPFALDRDIKMPKLTRRIISKIDNWPREQVEQAQPEWLDQPDDELVKKTLRRWAQDGLSKLRTGPSSRSLVQLPLRALPTAARARVRGLRPDRHPRLAVHDDGGRGDPMGRENGVIVGPGRLCCRIARGLHNRHHRHRPDSYGLIFERFHQPKPGMPDIDIDFMPGEEGAIESSNTRPLSTEKTTSLTSLRSEHMGAQSNSRRMPRL